MTVLCMRVVYIALITATYFRLLHGKAMTWYG